MEEKLAWRSWPIALLLARRSPLLPLLSFSSRWDAGRREETVRLTGCILNLCDVLDEQVDECRGVVLCREAERVELERLHPRRRCPSKRSKLGAQTRRAGRSADADHQAKIHMCARIERPNGEDGEGPRRTSELTFIPNSGSWYGGTPFVISAADEVALSEVILYVSDCRADCADGCTRGTDGRRARGTSLEQMGDGPPVAGRWSIFPPDRHHTLVDVDMITSAVTFETTAANSERVA